MNTKVFAALSLALVCLAASAAQVLEGDFATITIGTNTYTNAHLRAYSPTEGSLRHDGGMEKIRLADLPKPVRSKFYDEHKGEEDLVAKQQAAAWAAGVRDVKLAEAARADQKAALNGMPYTPHRIVNNQHFDLTPVYKWMMSGCQGPRPMQEWIGENYKNPQQQQVSGAFPGSYTALQVLPDVLLVQWRRYVNYPVYDQVTSLLALTNYPFMDKVVDNQILRFLAIRSGNYRYQTIAGSVSTIPLYDYGIACDAPPQHPAP